MTSIMAFIVHKRRWSHKWGWWSSSWGRSMRWVIISYKSLLLLLLLLVLLLVLLLCLHRCNWSAHANILLLHILRLNHHRFSNHRMSSVCLFIALLILLLIILVVLIILIILRCNYRLILWLNVIRKLILGLVKLRCISYWRIRHNLVL